MPLRTAMFHFTSYIGRNSDKKQIVRREVQLYLVAPKSLFVLLDLDVVRTCVLTSSCIRSGKKGKLNCVHLFKPLSLMPVSSKLDLSSCQCLDPTPSGSPFLLQKGDVPAAPSGTATLLRLSPNYQFYPRPAFDTRLQVPPAFMA